MKRSLVCPKCRSTEILHVKRLADRDRVATGVQHLAYYENEILGGLAKETRGAGPLEAYACSACGFVEHYLAEPIPIDGVHVVALHGPR